MKNLFKYNIFTMMFIAIKQWVNNFIYHSGSMKHPKTSNTIFGDTDVCVVYNKFSLDATLAAALLKGNPNVIKIIDNTKVIPTGFKNYMWLGIKPNLLPEGAFSELIGKNHEIVLPILDAATDYQRRVTIFERIAETVLESSKGLGFEIEKFFDPKLSEKEATRLYANCVHALDVLNGSVDKFRVLDYSDNQLSGFKFHVNSIKTKLNNNYGIQYVHLKNDRFVKAAVTCFNDDCFWAMRMMGLSHKHFVNVATTLNGTLVETNIDGFEGIEVESRIYNTKTM